jgi:arylsulfatase A-like enzyme
VLRQVLACRRSCEGGAVSPRASEGVVPRLRRIPTLAGPPQVPLLLVLLISVCGTTLVTGCAREDRDRSDSARVDPQRAPDVLLITVDTFRADRTSLLGNPRDTTPELRHIAAAGMSFDHALSTASWTLPSLASIQTGRLPSVHGAVVAESKLPRGIGTLAQAFAAAGYQTRAAVAHSFAGSKYGFDRGFDRFDESQARGHDAVTSEPLTRIVLHFARSADPSRPIFLWVHYFDPHFSYVRHPGFASWTRAEAAADSSRTRHWPDLITAGTLQRALDDLQRRGEVFPPAWLAEVEETYDEELAYTDHWIGELCRGWRNGREGRDGVVAITGDHGEYFLDRGRFFHGRDVYAPLVHVPLVLGGDLAPRWRGKRRSEVVSLLDLGRTLLDLAGADSERFPGRDLLDPSPRDDPVYTEGNYAWGEDDRKVGVVLDGLELIRHLDSSRLELYDLERDPHESRDLWPGRLDATPESLRERARRLRGLALDYPPESDAPLEAETVELSESERARLRSLGYTP